MICRDAFTSKEIGYPLHAVHFTAMQTGITRKILVQLFGYVSMNEWINQLHGWLMNQWIHYMDNL